MCLHFFQFQTKSTLDFAQRAKKIVQHAHVNEILDERAQFNRMKKEIEELKKTLEQSKNSDLNSELQLTNEQLEAEKKKNEDLLKKLKDQFLSSTQLWQSGDRFLAPAPGGNKFTFLIASETRDPLNHSLVLMYLMF